MGWLWQYAARWAGSKVWSQAKSAAVNQATGASDQRPGDEPTTTVMAAICETKRLFDAVADNLAGQRTIEGDQFAACKGKLGGRGVVVVRPLTESIDHAKLVTAIVDGHQPQFVLSAAEATSCKSDVAPGSIVIASRLVGAEGQSLKFGAAAPPVAGYYTGTVASQGIGSTNMIVDQEQTPLAEDNWSEPIARACQQAAQPVMVASVVLRAAPSERSREADSLGRQSTLAGQMGVLTGMLLKKRSGLREVWNEKEAAWEACSRLAKLAEHLAQAAAKTE